MVGVFLAADGRKVTTLKTNIDNHLEPIPLSFLPPNFHDAITITRRLSFQQTWIDPLWKAASVKMGSIYKNAVLNISADAASGAFRVFSRVLT